MVSSLSYTLLTDGPFDRALRPIIKWALINNGVKAAINGEWADLRILSRKSRKLYDRIPLALDYYPADLLIVHRDVEGATLIKRRAEIRRAIKRLKKQIIIPAYICVIPIRMTEAWMLFDKLAIRKAVGNPDGASQLTLPQLSRIENIADPKMILHNKIRTASELSGRRLAKLPVSLYASRVAEYITDFAPLRQLSAFEVFEDQLREYLAANPRLLSS